MQLVPAQNNPSADVHFVCSNVYWLNCGCLCDAYQNTKVTNISDGQRNDRNSGSELMYFPNGNLSKTSPQV